MKKVIYNLLITFIAYEDKEQKYDLHLIAGLFLKKRHIYKVQTRKHIISITKTWWYEIRKLEIRLFFIKYYLVQRSFIILLKPSKNLPWIGKVLFHRSFLAWFTSWGRFSKWFQQEGVPKVTHNSSSHKTIKKWKHFMVNQPVPLLCITFSQMKTVGFIWIIFLETLNVMRCAIWHHLYNSKTV